MAFSFENLPQAGFATNRPFFVYDLQIIRANVSRLREILATQKCEKHRLYFSLKANPNRNLLSAMQNMVDGFDVSSLAELKLVLSLGVKPESISVSGPAKTDEFLREAVRAGVGAIHVDAREEFELLKNHDSRICLRIADEMSASAKLGLSLSDLNDILRSEGKYKIQGFHAYLGTECFSSAKLSELVAVGEKLRAEFSTRFSADCAYYVGPGLPRLDLIGDDKLNGIQLGNLLDKSTPLNFECGRSLVGSAGFYVAPALSVKRKPKRNVLILNGGVQHINVQLFSRHSGDQGLQCAVLRDGKVLRGELSAAVVYGSLCTDNDILHPNISLPSSVKRGDWLAVGPCGAYNITASHSQFIGQPLASEWLVDSDADPETFQAKNISPASFRAYHESFHE